MQKAMQSSKQKVERRRNNRTYRSWRVQPAESPAVFLNRLLWQQAGRRLQNDGWRATEQVPQCCCFYCQLLKGMAKDWLSSHKRVWLSSHERVKASSPHQSSVFITKSKWLRDSNYRFGINEKQRSDHKSHRNQPNDPSSLLFCYCSGRAWVHMHPHPPTETEHVGSCFLLWSILPSS